MARQIRTTAEATAPAAPEPEATSAPEQKGTSVTFSNNVTNRVLILQDGTKLKFNTRRLTTSDPKLIENLTAYAAQPGSMISIQTAE